MSMDNPDALPIFPLIDSSTPFLRNGQIDQDYAIIN